MCRILVYKGQPMLIGDVLISPENSLLCQSRDAGYHPGVIDKEHCRNILVNGDGFGVAWYGDAVEKGSCCFKFVTPAWSNTNLRNIGNHISSSLIFGHIRAASSGQDPHEPIVVSNENCHPFTYLNYTFMHNGCIPKFERIKLRILNLLSEKHFHNIYGTTDSEHIFALFLECLPPSETEPLGYLTHSTENIVRAVQRTIAVVLSLCEEAGIKDCCSLNICVSNGVDIIATRYRNGPQPPPSLYYYCGSNFTCKDGIFHAQKECSASEIVISSAPLSKVARYECDRQATARSNAVSVPSLSSSSTVQRLSVTATQNAAMRSHHSSTNDFMSATIATVATASGATAAAATAAAATVAATAASASATQASAVAVAEMEDSGAAAAQVVRDAGTISAPITSIIEEDEELAYAWQLYDPQDNGSWVLVPKDHMLIVRGDRKVKDKVVGIEVVHIIVPKLSCPLQRPLHKYQRKFSEAFSDEENSTTGSDSARSASPKMEKPKKIRFRSRIQKAMQQQ